MSSQLLLPAESSTNRELIEDTASLSEELPRWQYIRMRKYFSPLLLRIMDSLWIYKIQFALAGSFAAYITNKIEESNDIDLYVNAESKEAIPYFMRILQKNKYAFKRYVSAKKLKYSSAKKLKYSSAKAERPKLRRNPPRKVKYSSAKVESPKPRKNPPRDPRKLLITNVETIQQKHHKSIDIVFAPNPGCCSTKLYSLYVIKHFDLQQIRVALFNPSRADHRLFHAITLATPSWDKVDEHRRIKYMNRAVNLTPSKLSLLSVNTLLDNGKFNYDCA